MWSSDVEYTIMHYPTLWLIRKSNRIESSIFTPRFLLKNRSKSIVHLKAGIVTALSCMDVLVNCTCNPACKAEVISCCCFFWKITVNLYWANYETAVNNDEIVIAQGSFWLHNVVKCGICDPKVHPSVHLSASLSHLCVTLKRFKISRYFALYDRGMFLVSQYQICNPEFRGHPLVSALKRGTPSVNSENWTNNDWLSKV